jgi:hypothetical protein
MNGEDSTSKSRKSIGILVGVALSSQNFERFGINELSKNLNVYLYDCRTLLNRTINSSSKDIIQFSDQYQIESIEKLKRCLENTRPDYVLDTIGPCSSTEGIRTALQDSEAVYIYWSPAPLAKPTISSRIRYFLDRHLFRPSIEKQIVKKPIEKLDFLELRKTNPLVRLVRPLSEYVKTNRISKLGSSIALISGEESLSRNTRSCEKILWTSSQDYFTFQEAKNKNLDHDSETPRGPYLLFIDDCLPNASDWALLKLQPPVSELNYYSNLTNYFNRMEEIFGLEVVIAGHPNSFEDSDISHKMGGRSVYFDKTAQLTINSSLVLAHATTAVSFAVLARKPIIFLSSKELSRTMTGLLIRSASVRLGARLDFIDRQNCESYQGNSLVVNFKKYACYERDYIRSRECQENQPWESLVSHILST